MSSDDVLLCVKTIFVSWQYVMIPFSFTFAGL
jgi:hypothetical protein